ncbi:MAG: RIP metalloprotease RseP [Betaproteobacteria bacterium]|nr:RIP metalloprotease RseP [Betaproteobacteria bacterium]
MLTLFAFIFTIGIIVTIHEYGHFQVARWCGVKVIRFSIGFGKPLWRKTLGTDQTEFVLAAIPLGGYVKMLDERELKAEKEAGETSDNDYSEADLTRAFNRQSVYKRIAIVIAGPMANLLLAILIYWVLFMQGVTGMLPIIGQVELNSIAAQANLTTGEMIQTINNKEVKTWSEAGWMLFESALENEAVEIKAVNENNELHLHKLNLAGLGKEAESDILNEIGISVFRPEVLPILAQVLSNSAAEKAGLLTDDKVLAIDGLQTDAWSDVVNIVKANPNQALNFNIERQQKLISLTVTPEGVKENNVLIGKIGAGVKLDDEQLDKVMIKQYYSGIDSLGMSIAKTWKTSAFSLKMMWYMVTGKASWKGISGPVTIANYAGESADLGWKPFLGFIALVSISIGILNLLPIPVLDGGHLMYYMVEIIKGSAVSEQAMVLGQKIGFGLLGLLMILAVFNDINRIVTG